MPAYAILDGKFKKENEIGISPNNRSFRYGDGFFETIRMVDGEIILKDLHFQRLFKSLDLLLFQRPAFFDNHFLEDQICGLAKKNQVQKLARIRLTFFRGEGGLYDPTNHQLHFLIQAWPLNPEINKLNMNGLQLGIMPGITKNNDRLSTIKSNNFLCYSMAALWVKQQKLNDCLLLNPFQKVADATIANVFIVHKNVIKTPLLQDGPVDGVMRRYLLNNFKETGMPFEECSLVVDDVLNATEVFLTNAIYGVKWVSQLEQSTYINSLTSQIYRRFIMPLFKI